MCLYEWVLITWAIQQNQLNNFVVYLLCKMYLVFSQVLLERKSVSSLSPSLFFLFALFLPLHTYPSFFFLHNLLMIIKSSLYLMYRYFMCTNHNSTQAHLIITHILFPSSSHQNQRVGGKGFIHTNTYN